MTEREWRLRKRIDTLSAELEQEQKRARRRERHQRADRHPAWCIYCGQRTKARKYPAVCREHRTLPKLDPYFSEAVA